MTIIVDTSAVVALYDEDQKEHRVVAEIVSGTTRRLALIWGAEHFTLLPYDVS